MHADVLPCVPSLVLIAKAVFLLDRGQIHRQSHRRHTLPTPACLMTCYTVKNIRLSTDILLRVFRNLTELVCGVYVWAEWWSPGPYSWIYGITDIPTYSVWVKLRDIRLDEFGFEYIVEMRLSCNFVNVKSPKCHVILLADVVIFLFIETNFVTAAILVYTIA